jgi:periplasmic mercuric ion binding protein
MKKLIGITIATLLLTNAAFAEPQQTRIEVTGLTCPSCPYIAAQAVESIDSVQINDGVYDPAAQLAVFDVSYDDELTSPADIAAAPEEYGYPARVIEHAASGS